MQTILARVQAALGEQWFSGESEERIQAVLALFSHAPARGFLLEQTLTTAESEIDLNLYFDPPISAGYNPIPFTVPDAHPLWQNLSTFWQLWATDPEFAPITNCWLEFDTRQLLPPIPIPGIFFRLDSAEFQPWYTDRALATLLGHTLPFAARQILQTCFAHIPQRARVSHLGLMLSRPAYPMRVYIRDVPPLEVSAYLRAVDFPGNIEEAQNLASVLAEKTNRLNLQLDIPVDDHGLSPRISLEAKIDRKTGTWTNLLTFLVAENLCTSENKTHLLNWPAKQTLQDPACTVKKYINHIKITLAPDMPPQAKAYLGVFITPILGHVIPHLRTLTLDDIPRVGSKAARMGELARAGFNIPAGFVIPNTFFHSFLEHNRLTQLVQTLLSHVPTGNLFQISSQIQQHILSAALPVDLENAISQAIPKITSPFIAIRSSASDEDLSRVSFAGLYDTFLNIEKNDLSTILEKIKACYASLYCARALSYRQQKRLPLASRMAIILQEMIPSDLSGVTFTSSPSPSQTTIETVPGLGEGLVSGTQEPEKLTLENQNFQSQSSLLSTSQLLLLLETTQKIECHFQQPQDIEWSFVEEILYILQTRPQTSPVHTISAEKIYAAARAPLIEGRIAKTPLQTIPTEPYILLIDRPHPQYVPFLQNALAVIAEQGGLLNHFAIVCRELAIPFVVIKNAFQTFQEGETLRLEINPTFSPTPKTYSDDGWVALTRFIPPLKDQTYKAKLERTIQNIPGILDQTYSIQAEVRPEGIFIHETSTGQIISTALFDLPRTLTALQKQLSEKYDLSLGLLSAILVEPLFQHLTALVGDPNTALSLLRGVVPLYLSFGETYICQGDEPYLLRFGLQAGDKLHIPASLANRASEKQPFPFPFSTLHGENTAKIETLTELIRLLVTAYEGKNKRPS